MTEEETTEAMQVAMTVGATRMQVMLSTEQANLGAAPEPSDPAASATSAVPTSSANAQPEPATFTAAEVLPQAGGG